MKPLVLSEYGARTRRLIPFICTLALLILLGGAGGAGARIDNEGPLGPGWVQRALGFQYQLGSDLPLRNTPWIGTHNSFNSIAEMGPTLSVLDGNQRLSIEGQLRQGVRAIEIDLHWFPSLRGGGFAPVVCHSLEGGVGCSIEKPLDTVLAEIGGWLREPDNRDQAILLYLEDDLATGQEGYDASAEAIETELGDLVYRTPGGSRCSKLPLSLTRDEVIESGAQVLLVSNCGPGPAWSSLVFDWSGRVEQRPRGFTDFPACGSDFERAEYERGIVRYFEDSTMLSAATGSVDDGLTSPTVASMARCGVDVLGLDQLVYPDSRLAAAVWSWAPGEPGPASCAVQRVDAAQPFGRWHSRRCDLDRRASCRRDGRWVLGRGKSSFQGAAAACRRVGGQLAVPRTGYEAQRLRLAMERAWVSEVWLGYRRLRGGWAPVAG